jgi:hypothetical protein
MFSGLLTTSRRTGIYFGTFRKLSIEPFGHSCSLTLASGRQATLKVMAFFQRGFSFGMTP